MMRWQVRLEGEEYDLEDLPGMFTEPSARVVRAVDGSYYLESDTLAPLAVADAVNDAASSLIRLLNGVLLLKSGSYEAVKIGPVVELNSDGTRNHNVFVGVATLRARSKVHAAGVVTSGAPAAPAGPPDSARMIDLAAGDNDVSDALVLWGDHPHDWITLYKVFEIMGKPDHPDKGRFTHTANHPDASGEQSRHGRMNTPPPPNPLPLDEAEAMIRVLLESWLRGKLSP